MISLVIIVEGGIVQGVYAEDPNDEGVAVVVVDHDTDGIEEDRLTILDEETQNAASVFELPVDPASALLPEIANAAARVFEEE